MSRPPAPADEAGRGRLVAVELDTGLTASVREFVSYERKAAIRDLIRENSFLPVGRDHGEFRLRLSMADRSLVLDIAEADSTPVMRHILSLTPLKSVMKDYFLICDTYYAMLATASRARIEAIDIGRRGIHNEGSQILRQRLERRVTLDFGTSRRLFTLVCALTWRR